MTKAQQKAYEQLNYAQRKGAVMLGGDDAAELAALIDELGGKRPPATAMHIARARTLYGTDDIEMDDNATLSVADDGVWVSAWVWLPGATKERA